MLFQSFEFIIFLIAFILTVLVWPRKHLLPIVTLASLAFYYWWYPPYIALMLLMILLAWSLSKLVYNNEKTLPYAILIVISPLVFFKYTRFVLDNISDLINSANIEFHVALPLGISFITFTIISLLVDTVKNKKKPPTFFETSSYITFFPHLIAGPILRAASTIPQFKSMHVDWQAFPAALTLFSVGIIKKVMIADPIGVYIDTAYANVHTLNFIEASTAMLGFSLQIYCDFSAYTDMAIALAIMFGIKFPENFKSPYLQKSITATWSCWHMTLTHWLRDYVLIPIYSRTRHFSRHLAIILTMLLSGLWHGANWTFIIWGLCNGLIIWLESVTGYAEYTARQNGIIRYLLIVINLIFWSLICVLFRAEDLNSALAMWSAISRIPESWSSANGHILCLCGLILLTHKYDQANIILAKAKSINSAISIPVTLAIIIGGIIIFQGRPQTFYYFDF